MASLMCITLATQKYRQKEQAEQASSLIHSEQDQEEAHSPQQPSVSPPSPGLSAPESYFTVYASYFITCPRLTLRAAAVFEKNDGQTDGWTNAHTHRLTTITVCHACTWARVNMQRSCCPVWVLQRICWISMACMN